MIRLQGIQVDIAGSDDALLAEHAVFTIEFEYDSKLLVCHTRTSTVKKELEKLIKKTLGPKETNLQLRQALQQSEYITVQVKKSNIVSQQEALDIKYDLIRSNSSYMPYGHNSLLSGLNKDEKVHAKALMASLMHKIDGGVKAQSSSNKSKRVYRYDKSTGFYIDSYTSTLEASKITGVCQSNISMCCKGHIKSAGNFIWSYEKVEAVAIPEDKRKKFTLAPPTTVELKSRMHKFIKENQL